jgi:sugar phosphate isomerase/epimerase
VGVKTLRQAWSIVSTSDRPNGGIVFDTLHYVRSGSTLDMLKEIPGDRVHCVQLNDGPLRLPAGVTLEENCFDRGWPGTGEFPLIEIVRTLAEMDALRQVSPEVFSLTTPLTARPRLLPCLLRRCKLYSTPRTSLTDR